MVLAVSGCAHYPLNVPLTEYRETAGYRFPAMVADRPDPADRLFVCLALSGGGTRAAALAYGVFEKLRDTPIDRAGTRSLLDEVDCISSVSGGSFTAAYYALFGDRLFKDFDRRFLLRNLHEELALRVANPWNLLRLASPWYGRIDVAAELYAETIFDGRTFAALDPKRRPFILLNATSMANGGRFQFTQEQFDLIGSDLAPFSVARAVASSSAFPFLLSPVSLWSRRSPAGFSLPDEYTNALEDRERNPSRYYWARQRLESLATDDAPKYIHLLDGGLADNLGLRAIMNEYDRSGGFIGPRVRSGHVKRLVVIVVNARTDPPEHLSRQEHAPSIVAVALKTATVSMEHVSLDTIQLMRKLQEERDQLETGLAACNARLASCPGVSKFDVPAGSVRMCVVEVNFEALQPAARRDRFLSLPTTFSLPERDVRDLIAVGHELLEQSPAFQKLLRALKGETELGAGIGEQGNCS